METKTDRSLELNKKLMDKYFPGVTGETWYSLLIRAEYHLFRIRLTINFSMEDLYNYAKALPDTRDYTVKGDRYRVLNYLNQMDISSVLDLLQRDVNKICNFDEEHQALLIKDYREPASLTDGEQQKYWNEIIQVMDASIAKVLHTSTVPNKTKKIPYNHYN
jgi:hypothetical protein